MANKGYWKNTGDSVFKDTGDAAWKTSADYMEYPAVLFVETWGLKLGITISEPYDNVYTPVILLNEYYFDASIPLLNFIEAYNDATVPLIKFIEAYSDTPTPLILMYEPYSNVAEILSYMLEVYNDATNPIALMEEKWTIFADILTMVVEPYAITDVIVQAVLNELWNLEQYNKVQSVIEEPYYLLTDNSYISTPTASIEVNGVAVDFLSINLSAGLSQYCLLCSVELPSEEEYSKCAFEDEAVCIINGETYNFFVETKEKTETNEGTTYSLSLLSPTAKLDAPYSKTIVENFPTGIYTHALIQQMADYENVTVDFQILNWFLPSSVISINDETPLEVIKRVVNAVGAIVQTKPNGDILIISEYPVSPSLWGTTTPSVIFDKAEDLISLAELDIINTGYNAFIISDSGSSSDNIYLREENITDTSKIIKGFRIPFSDGEFDLETSGGVEVTMDKYTYPVEEQIPDITGDEEWEIVEFVDWVGSTTYPIYSIVDWDWIEEDLGAFTFSEDGTLTVTNQSAVPGESLLRIKYMTKYWRWTVTGPSAKHVQFFVPEEE